MIAYSRQGEMKGIQSSSWRCAFIGAGTGAVAQPTRSRHPAAGTKTKVPLLEPVARRSPGRPCQARVCAAESGPVFPTAGSLPYREPLPTDFRELVRWQ